MDLIKPYDVWKQVNEIAQAETAGYGDDLQFNLDILATNYQIFDSLFPFYEGNEDVASAFRPLQKNVQLAKAANVAFVTIPTDLYRRTGINIVISSVTYPAIMLRKNSKAMILSSPVRQPSSPNNLCIEFTQITKLNVYPANVLCVVDIDYLIEPKAGSLTMTPVSDANSTYLNFTSQVDIPYDSSVFNLYCYLMLERLGVKMEDQLVMAYSKLGIDRNQVNPNPKTV